MVLATVEKVSTYTIIRLNSNSRATADLSGRQISLVTTTELVLTRDRWESVLCVHSHTAQTSSTWVWGERLRLSHSVLFSSHSSSTIPQEPGIMGVCMCLYLASTHPVCTFASCFLASNNGVYCFVQHQVLRVGISGSRTYWSLYM